MNNLFQLALTSVAILFLLAATAQAFAMVEPVSDMESTELELIDATQMESETSVEGECRVSQIDLFIGQRDIHLFMCAEITYSCPDREIVSTTAFGATNMQDQHDCEANPRPAHVVPFNSTLQSYCDRNLPTCIEHINAIGNEDSNTDLFDLFVAPLAGAPCRNAVEDFVDLLEQYAGSTSE